VVDRPWYGGHELGRTFGRDRPGFCNGNNNPANGPIDASFPYPNGQISDASPTSFAGLDVGDRANSIPLTVLWATSTFDVMTYCNQPTWPSAYTYEAIRNFLIVANYLESGGGGAPAVRARAPLLIGHSFRSSPPAQGPCRFVPSMLSDIAGTPDPRVRGHALRYRAATRAPSVNP